MTDADRMADDGCPHHDIKAIVPEGYGRAAEVEVLRSTRDYYGTKRVTAWPQDRYVGGDVHPAPQAREGYRVRYEDGYESWSPKDVFEAAYKPITAMGFEGALAAMKAGHKVRRAVWPEVASIYIRDQGMITDVSSGRRVSEDLLADDWMIVT